MPGPFPCAGSQSYRSAHACHLRTHGSLRLNSSSPSLPRCLVPEPLSPSAPSWILSHLLSCPGNFPVSHSGF